MSNENNDLNATAALSLAITTGDAAAQLTALRNSYLELKTAFSSELDGSKASQQLIADNKKLREEVVKSRNAIAGLKEDLQRVNDKASVAAGDGMGKLRTAVSGLSQSTSIATKDMANFNAVTGRLKNEIVALATAGVDLGSVIKGVKLDKLNGDNSIKSLTKLINTLDEAKRASENLASQKLSAPENLNRTFGQGVNELIANLDKIKTARDSLIGRQDVAKAVGESNARLVAEMQKGLAERKKLQDQEVKDFAAYKAGLRAKEEAENARVSSRSVIRDQIQAEAQALSQSMKERESLYLSQNLAEERAAANLVALKKRTREQLALENAAQVADEQKKRDLLAAISSPKNARDFAAAQAQDLARSMKERESLYLSQNLAEERAAKALLELKERTRNQLKQEQAQELRDLEKANALKLAQARMANRQAQASGRYLAASPVGQANINLKAGSALFGGADVSSFAPEAVAAAQAAGSVDALIKAKQGLAAANTRLTPAIKASTDHQIHWNKVSKEGHALARGLSGSLGALWITYGSLAPLIAGAAIAGSMKAVVTAGKEVEFQLTFVKAITEGAAVSFDDLAKSMEGSMFTPIEATKGLRTLAQAGLSTSEALAALPNVLKLATVGETDMANAALSATSIMHTFGKSVNDIGNIGDVFGKAAAISATSVREMMEAMKQAAAISSVFGVSMEETAAGLATLANRGIEGSAAGTALRNMVKELASPATEKAANAMKQVGIEIFNADGSAKSFSTNLQQLKDAVASMDAQSKARFLEDLFNERGAKAAAILLEDLDKMKTSLSDIKLASSGLGFMTEASILLSQSVEGMSKTLASGFQTTLVEAFKAVEPEIKAVLSSITSLVTSTGFKDFFKSTAEVVAGLSRSLVEHGDVVLVVVASYAGFKGISLALAAATAAWKYYNTVVAGAAAVSAAASSAMVGPVASGAVAAATSAITGYSAAVMSVVTAGLRFIPVIGAITAAAWAASQAFDSTSESMSEYLHSVEGVVEANARLADSTAKAVEQAWREAEAYSEQVKKIGEVGSALKGLSETKLELEKTEVERSIRGLEIVKRFDDESVANDPTLARGGSRSESEIKTSSAIAAALAREKETLASLNNSILVTRGIAEIRKTNDEEAAGRKKVEAINKSINETLDAGVRAQERINAKVKDPSVLKRLQEAVDRARELRKRLGGDDGKIFDLDVTNFRKPGVLTAAEDRETILKSIGVKYDRSAATRATANNTRTRDLLEEVRAERLLAEEKARAAAIGEVADTATFKAKAAINKAYRDGEKLSANYVLSVLEEAEAHDKVNEAARVDAERRKVFKEMTDAQAEFVAESRKGNAALEDQIKAGELELSMIGKTAEEKERLAAASKEQQAVLADEIAAVYEAAAAYAGLNDNYVLKTSGDSFDTYSSLAEQSRQRAQNLRRLSQIDTDKGFARANVDAQAEAKRMADETRRQWNRVADDIEKWLSDSLYNAFENGKDFGQSFAEAIKSTLLRASFRIAVDAVVNPVMNGVRSALGVGGQQQGLNIPGLGGNMYSNFATSGFGQALGLSELTGASMIAGSAPLTLATGGVNVASTLGALSGNIATTAASTAATGATMTGLGSTIGAALPWVGGALAVASALGAFGDDPDAMRTAYFKQGGAKGGYKSVFGKFNVWEDARWFGDGLGNMKDPFLQQIAATDKTIVDTLELTPEQIDTVAKALARTPRKQAEFGMEHTDWLQSSADDQFKAQRYSVIAKALGKSIADITAIMSGSYNQLRVDLAKPITNKLAETLAKLDAQANFRAGTNAEIETVRGTFTLDKRIADMQMALARITESSEWIGVAEQVRSLIVERYNEEVAKIEEAKQKANELGDALVSVSNTAKSLLLSDLSPLTNAQRFSEASSQYQSLLIAARSGDINAVNGLSGAAQSYLGEARTMYASSGSYTSIFNDVQGTLAALGLTSESVRNGSWQTQLIDLQNTTADQLTDLNITSEAFTEALETQATEQLAEIRKLNLTQQQTNVLLEGVDQRIADLITAVQKMEGTVSTTTQKTGDKTARAIAELASSTVRN